MKENSKEVDLYHHNIEPWLFEAWQEAFANRDQIRRACFDILRCSNYIDFFSYLRQNNIKVAALFAIGGSSKRFNESIKGIDNTVLVNYGISAGGNFQRSFTLVETLLPEYFKEKMPVAALNLYQVMLALPADLLTPIIIYQGEENGRICRKQILEPLGLEERSVMVEQEKVRGRVWGHGAALVSALADKKASQALESSHLITVNFGGDPNSRLTYLDSLLVACTLNELDIAYGLVLPTTRLKEAKYQLIRDEQGRPINSVKPRDDGLSINQAQKSESNVGLRIYSSSVLLEKLMKVRKTLDDTGWYFSEENNIPGGNFQTVAEFNLDLVDVSFMAGRLAFALCIADPKEIQNNFKSFQDLGGWLTDMHQILEDDKNKLQVT